MKKTVVRAIEEIGAVYTDLAETHGTDAKAAGYHDEAKRNLRYDVLAEIFEISETPETFSVAELGCGYGAFYTYLDEKLPGRISRYDGYDVSDEMLRRGREHLEGRSATLMKEMSVVREADYVFISGIFNVRMSASVEEWGQYVKDTLMASFAKAKIGLAFNVLSSSKVDFKNEKFFYYDPGDFIEFCTKNLSSRYKVDQSYPLYEMTCCVLRSQ